MLSMHNLNLYIKNTCTWPIADIISVNSLSEIFFGKFVTITVREEDDFFSCSRKLMTESRRCFGERERDLCLLLGDRDRERDRDLVRSMNCV